MESVVNAVTAFFTPTFEAALPEVVGPRLYTRAVSLSRVAVDLEAAGGPVVAGVLIAWVGVQWTFWFDSLTYLVSAGLVLASRVPRAAPPTERFPWRDFVPQVTYGTRVLLRVPALRQALLLHFAEAAAGAVVIVTTVAYVRDELGRRDAAFAWTWPRWGSDPHSPRCYSLVGPSGLGATPIRRGRIFGTTAGRSERC